MNLWLKNLNEDDIPLEDVLENLSKFKREVDASKIELGCYLDEVSPDLRSNSKLTTKNIDLINSSSNEVNRVVQNLDDIKKKQLPDAIIEQNRLLDRLNQINLSLEIVEHVCDIHDNFEALDKYQDSCSYNEAVKAIENLDLQILKLNRSENNPVGFVKDLKDKLHYRHLVLEKFLLEQKNKYIVAKSNKSITLLEVTKNKKDLELLLSAIYKVNKDGDNLASFVQFVWKYIFKPVVKYRTKINISEQNDMNVLNITAINQEYVDFKTAFMNIETIVNFFHNNLNSNLSPELTLMNFIGEYISDNLSELIIRNCLSNTIPNSIEELNSYNSIIQFTESLEARLLSSGLYSTKTDSIVSYVKNVDVHYVTKKSNLFKEKAELIIKREFTNLVEVGESNGNGFCENIFQKCLVSKHTIELLELCEEILKEIQINKKAKRLIDALKDIIFNYPTKTLKNHSQYLETLPQQVAVFYNNCFYLANQITNWNEKFTDLLKEINFDKEINNLKSIGDLSFDKMIAEQKNHIETILKDANLHNCKTLDSLPENMEKMVRQCLRQQELLKTVWQKVLPYTKYNITLGLILDFLCGFLFNCVVHLEDIGAACAEQLSETFKVVLNRGPKLFTDNKEIYLYVSSWHKFNELVFVLNANLMDIEDRWADGKGPLALYFEAYQLKQLIRALFQNTKRRDVILAKIH